MQSLIVDRCVVEQFLGHLASMERSHNTIVKYRHDLNGFCDWLGGADVTKEKLLEYKHALQLHGKAPSSINSTLSALNHLMAWLGHPELKLAFLKIQQKVFREAERDLTKADYDKLVDTAYGSGKERLGLVLETLGATGMRISELQYVTVEALCCGQADIDLKNKLRTVMLPSKLCQKLKAYCKKQGISSGEVFRTRTGRALTRQEIWREMKVLCRACRIPDSKVYPHNFRHMFATVFYSSCKDIVKLADVLGHSSVNTTRIYLISSGKEHAKQLEKLNLVH